MPSVTGVHPCSASAEPVPTERKIDSLLLSIHMVRIKRRYFVFHIHFADDNDDKQHYLSRHLKPNHIQTSLEQIIQKLYGDYGSAKFLRSLTIIYYNPVTNLSIIRCLRENKVEMKTVATFTTHIGPYECSLQTLHVAGSIRQCKKFLVKYCTQTLLQMNMDKKTTTTATSDLLILKKKKGFGATKKYQSIQQQQQIISFENKKTKILQSLLIDSRIDSQLISSNIEEDDNKM
ncbi:unnamed protein product [Didymodactylos carnosus]|uniref:Uncharacterized protein n=1 Tax=Didymodactylos carnosus TaxID=1234261 RepID=A0A814JA67_9BILA|nr:unnamed protein product [Didymodactylos carnosus]CAF1034000.1 unnamed protein product [Didymodactylos carnosus]CAF3577291.1 unnamed protein product [Didymodactylos carnosus]CAF3804680.1 unnamed protein product [Didymodactylos carnosus]